MNTEIPTAEQLRLMTEQRTDELLATVKTEGEAIEEATDRLIAAVRELRTIDRATWKDIGEQLGISGPAAYQRYGKRI